MTPREFQLYLQRFAQQLRLPGQERSAITEELRDHMHTRFCELRGQGMDERDAIGLVLREFGEAAELASPLDELHRQLHRRERRRRTLLGLAGMAASIVIGVCFWPADLSESILLRHITQDRQVHTPDGTGIKEISMHSNIALSGMMAGMIGLLSTTDTLQAVPQTMNHQGVIAVNGTRFTGTGEFRFAIIDPQDGDKNRWTHDGSGLNAAAMPTSGVDISVNDGIYSLSLGGAPMQPLNASVFADSTLSLRIWFTHNGGTPEQLAPDHALTASPYALRAESVSDGSIITASLSNSSVTNGKLASDAGSLAKVSGGAMASVSNKIGIGTASPTESFQVQNGNVLINGWSPYMRLGAGSGGQPAIQYITEGIQRFALFTEASASGAFCALLRYDNNGNFMGTPSYAWGVLRSNGYVGLGMEPGLIQHPLHMASGARCTAGGVWTNASSRDYKDNITPLHKDEAMQAFTSLEPVRFTYTTAEQEKHVGFIAEDVPELVASPDRKGLSSMNIVAVLTKVVQEQQSQIDHLEQANRQMEQRLRMLESNTGN